MDKLQFFRRSADKPAGKGVGEYVNDSNNYTELNKIKDWRKIFCSLWSEESFEYEGYYYKSYEHAFQSEKFRCNGYNDIAFMFTIESNTKLGNSDGLDAYKARKIKKLLDDEMDKWHQLVNDIKDKLYLNKFTKIEKAKNALILTGEAEIWNDGPRIKRLRCTRLEKTRNIIKEL